MKLIVLLVAAVFVSAAFASRDAYTGRFADWMHKHNKHYAAQEFHHRFGVWKKNMQFVENFRGTHQVAMNTFGDLTNEEFKAIYNGFRVPENRMMPLRSAKAAVDVATLPSSVDWRSKGAVTPRQESGSVRLVLVVLHHRLD
jgi:hypothetical protein